MHVVMERGPRPGESDGLAAADEAVPDADELAAQALLDALARPNGSGASGRHGRTGPTLGAGGLVTRVVDSFRSARAWWVAAAVVVGGTVLLLVARPASTAVPVELPRASAAPVDAAAPAGSAAPGGSVGGTGSAGGTGASSTTVTSSVATASASLVVHVAGAVLRPGLVTLPAGARTADALMAAGGPRPDADLERVNLAEPMSDGARWYVPTVGQEVLPSAVGAAGPAAVGPAVAAGSGVAPTAPVDLNTADAALLDTLPGVGPSTAAAIVAYRNEHGRFGNVDELQEVRGIGPAKFASIEPLVVVR